MMPHSVTTGSSDRAVGRLPGIFQEGAVLIRGLAARGLLTELAQRLIIPRQGGYVAVDAWAYLVLMWTAQSCTSRSWIWQKAVNVAEPLGALWGRSSLMSSSALSRLLSSATDDTVSSFAHWLLLEASSVRNLLLSRLTALRDAQGDYWFPLAYDPVRIGIRCTEQHHPPPRRCQALGRKGHLGRKRGELVFTTGVLEALGSSVVLNAWVYPGNGSMRLLFAQALQAVLDFVHWLGLELCRTLLLVDGEFGSVPVLTMAHAEKLPLLTRSSRYTLLDDPVLWRRLEQGRWEAVEHNGTGPQRFACEVGQWLLAPGPTTKTNEGTPFAPVEVRLVVSRYTALPQDTGRGRLIGGERYELFVSLRIPATAFPAADVVALFYARCGQECHFQQQQKQMGLYRLVSFHPAGQRYAMLVGFFLHNLRLAAGVALCPPLPDVAAQRPRSPATVVPPVCTRVLSSTQAVEEEHTAPDAAAPSTSSVSSVDASLASLDWDQLLHRRRGWSFDNAQRSLRTSEGEMLPLSGVECKVRSASLRFSRSRPQLLQSSVALPVSVAQRIREQLEEERQHSRSLSQQSFSEASSLPQLRARSGVVCIAQDGPAAPYAVEYGSLLGSKARRIFIEQAQQAVFTVRAGPRLPPIAAAHPLVQPSRARRQHRRLTHQQHLERYQQRQPYTIDIEAPTDALTAWLTPEPRQMGPPNMT